LLLRLSYIYDDYIAPDRQLSLASQSNDPEGVSRFAAEIGIGVSTAEPSVPSVQI
jgi:hypothetical protein